MKIKACNANEPVWKEISVRSSIPEALKPLGEIAHNMWWSWNSDVSHLFQDIDKDLWKKVGQNPVLFLARMNYAKLEEVAKDASIVKRVNKIYSDFRKYMDVKPDSKRPSVAYLCMEYGLSHVLKIYSGGLGILAGDYLKEASDSNVDMCAVGFLYRYGYFTQTLSMNGDQIANYEAQNFGDLPIERELDQNGQPLVVDVPFNNYTVHAFVWRVNVGRIKLYLLDTDNEMNSEYDRSITHSLYGGDWENRLKQEILLGIGGILTLKKLGIKKDIYHCNEGHAALCNVQRLTHQFLQVMITLMRVCLANTWVRIQKNSVFLGMTLLGWAASIPMIMVNVFVCQHLPAILLHGLMALVGFMEKCQRTCSIIFGRVISQKNLIMWAM